MKNKIIYLTYIFLSLSTISFSQNTYFSKRYSLGYPATIFNGVLVTDSCLYLKGEMINTDGIRGSFLLQGDFDGNIKWFKDLSETGKTVNTAFTRLGSNINGNLVVCGQITDSVNQYAYIAEFDTKGNHLKTGSFFSPYSPSAKPIIPLEWLQTPDGSYLLSGNLTVSTVDQLSIFLAKLNNDLELEWLKQYGSTTLREGVGAMCLDSMQNIIIGGSNFKNPIFANTVFQKYIFETDSTGNVVNWEWYYPPTGNINNKGWVVRDMFLLEDNSIIGGSAVSKEFMVNMDMSNTSGYASIFKLAPDHTTVLWETKLGNGTYSWYGNEIIRVLPANDGNGYIGLGNMYDTTFNSGPQLGIIAKVAENGDSLWMRTLQFQTDTVSINQKDQMHDILPSTDGNGYWIAAESRQPEADTTIVWQQQGWLLKVDNYGCIVPNCHLTDQDKDVELPSGRLLLYPNPARDYIAVYHDGYTWSKGLFSIVDVTGKVQKIWRPALDEISTVCELTGLAPGSYFLQYAENDRIVVSRKFQLVH